MSLNPGSRLGPYEVLSPLGSGGMGEVFRARDSRLGRDVAIKVLPEAFALDPERLARFEREARLLASLSHPNIAGIHGLEEADGRRHLILELVEGETLADRLAQGPLPLTEALEACRQIAAALDAAHEAGIVHRDLKPGNVMLTPAGDVKVLDFGLARGGSATTGSNPNVSASPTMTYAATATGIILGTAAYMSPEQSRGRAVDRRTDIWSFGCVFYECLTGKILFSGETVSDSIAKILEREPDWSALPANTPPRVRELLRRCLEKDARKRQRDAGDIRLEIDEILTGGAGASGFMAAPADTAIPGVRGAPSRLPWIIAGASLLGTLALLFSFLTSPEPEPTPLARFLIKPVFGTQMSDVPSNAAISPDGRLIVFVASDSLNRNMLWLRPRDSLEPRLIPRSEVGNSGLPFWSTDSKTIGYFADGKLRTIGLDGGSPQILCDAPDGRGGTWNRDGVIVFAPTSQGVLHRVASSGGRSEPVTTLDQAKGETAHRFPRFLPDGRRFTFASLPQRDGNLETWVGTLGLSERKHLTTATSSAVFVAPGAIIFTRGPSLMAQRCAPSTLIPEGQTVPVGDAPANLRVVGTNPVSVSDRGDLIFPTSVPTLTYLEWFSRTGTSLGRLSLPEGQWYQPVFSPNDRQLAIMRATDAGSDLWLADPIRGTATPLTTNSNVLGPPRWTADGNEVIYSLGGSSSHDIDVRKVTGSFEERPILKSSGMFKTAHTVTTDGRYLVYTQIDPVTLRDIWILPLTGGSEPVPYLNSRFDEWRCDVSPDGRWLAYESYESGRPEIYIQSFPTPGRKTQVSTTGGTIPSWTSDGRELIYSKPLGQVMSVQIRSGDNIEISTPVELGPFPANAAGGDITSDGQRCILVRPVAEFAGNSLTLVMNWESLIEK